MISALVITRVLADFAIRRRYVRGRPGLTGITSTGRVRAWLARRNPRLVHHRRRRLGVSALLIVVAVAGIVVRGLDFGVEFTGGRLVEYSTSRPVDVDAARTAVTDAGFPRAVVQESGDGNISVRTGELSNDQQHTIRMVSVHWTLGGARCSNHRK